jgi:hypothetical protein
MDWPQAAAISIPALCTLAAGLGGTALADRRAATRDDHARREQRRDELRKVIGECLIDSRSLIDSEWILIPAYATMSNTDLQEFAETDTGREAGARHRRLQRALTEARLLVGAESELGQALRKLKVLHDNLADHAHGPVMGKSKTRDEKMNGVSEGFKYIAALRDVVDEAENASLKMLAALD